LVATCKLNEEEKVKDGIENELIVVKDKKGNEEIVKKQLRKIKPICCHKSVCPKK
jgi:hypothetical protein